MPLLAEPVAVVLKRDTALHHHELEQALVPKLTGLQSPGDYCAILKTFYGFFAPLQQRIEEFITPAFLPDFDQRRKASLLLKDLEKLGRAADPIPLCLLLPAVNSVAEAFGALYVLEGATLGGQMISKMLLKNPVAGITEDQLHFFRGYRERTGPMWKSYLEVLNAQPDPGPIIAAANDTFLSFQNWIILSLYSPHAN